MIVPLSTATQLATASGWLWVGVQRSLFRLDILVGHVSICSHDDGPGCLLACRALKVISSPQSMRFGLWLYRGRTLGFVVVLP